MRSPKSPSNFVPTTTEQDFLSDHFYKVSSDGHISAVSISTGEVVGSTRGKDEEALSGLKTPLESILQKGWHYSPIWADIICDMISQGKTLKYISSLAGMPPTTVIARWRKQHPEFGEAYESARAARAEILHDVIYETANEVASPDEVAGEKLRFEKMKYLASVNDPDRFGNRIKHSGDDKRPLKFVIDTGIGVDNEKSFTGEDFDGDGIYREGITAGGEDCGVGGGESEVEGEVVEVGDIEPSSSQADTGLGRDAEGQEQAETSKIDEQA